MAQPKKKVSRSRRGARRSHWNKVTEPNLFKCPDCGSFVLAHQACLACGKYKGRQVIDLDKKKTKAKKDDSPKKG